MKSPSVPSPLPLRAQPLDRRRGDYETRSRSFSVPPGLQTSVSHEVADRALAHPEHPGGLPGLYVLCVFCFVLEDDGLIPPDLLRCVQTPL